MGLLHVGKKSRMEPLFDHEKLNVYQEAIEFVAWWHEAREQCSEKASVKDHLDRASASVPLNIAEGNGKFAQREHCPRLGS